MARTRASQAASAAFGKVGTVTVPRDANGTEPAVDTLAAPPVPQGPAQRRAAGKRATTPPPAEMDDPDLIADWHMRVNTYGLKAAAAQAKADAAWAVWDRLMVDARKSRVPAKLLSAWAVVAGVDGPEDI